MSHLTSPPPSVPSKPLCPDAPHKVYPEEVIRRFARACVQSTEDAIRKPIPRLPVRRTLNQELKEVSRHFPTAPDTLWKPIPIFPACVQLNIFSNRSMACVGSGKLLDILYCIEHALRTCGASPTRWQHPFIGSTEFPVFMQRSSFFMGRGVELDTLDILRQFRHWEAKAQAWFINFHEPIQKFMVVKALPNTYKQCTEYYAGFETCLKSDHDAFHYTAFIPIAMIHSEQWLANWLSMLSKKPPIWCTSTVSDPIPRHSQPPATKASPTQTSSMGEIVPSVNTPGPETSLSLDIPEVTPTWEFDFMAHEPLTLDFPPLSLLE